MTAAIGNGQKVFHVYKSHPNPVYPVIFPSNRDKERNKGIAYGVFITAKYGKDIFTNNVQRSFKIT